MADFLTILGINAGKTKAAGSVKAFVPATQKFKTAAYAQVTYPKSPVVTDTVPTKNIDGTPLLAGYYTPNNVWVA